MKKPEIRHNIFTTTKDKGEFSVSSNTLRVYYANHYTSASINGAKIEPLATIILAEMVNKCKKMKPKLLV